MVKKCDFEVKIPITILTEEMQTVYSEEIICSFGRIRVNILFMLTLLLLVTNPYFLFLMPVNAPVLFKLSFFVSMQ